MIDILANLDPSCTGKQAWSDKGAVLRHLRKRSSKVNTKTGRRGLHPYHCRRCGAWHIGSDAL